MRLGQRGCVAGANTRQPGHQLPGAVFLDAEELFHRLTEQVACVDLTEHVRNFRKSMKPKKLPRHPESSLLHHVRERTGIMSFSGHFPPRPVYDG